MWRRINSFNDLFDVLREFDALSRRTGGSLPAVAGSATPSTGSDWTWTPAVDCFTRDKDLVLRAELPGIDPSKLDVSVQGRTLTLRGEKQASHETNENDVHYREIVRGRFERTFTLPENLKADDVKASYINGVLEITMPAEGISTARRVPVEMGPESRKSIKAA